MHDKHIMGVTVEIWRQVRSKKYDAGSMGDKSVWGFTAKKQPVEKSAEYLVRIKERIARSCA